MKTYKQIRKKDGIKIRLRKHSFNRRRIYGSKLMGKQFKRTMMDMIIGRLQMEIRKHMELNL